MKYFYKLYLKPLVFFMFVVFYTALCVKAFLYFLNGEDIDVFVSVTIAAVYMASLAEIICIRAPRVYKEAKEAFYEAYNSDDDDSSTITKEGHYGE